MTTVLASDGRRLTLGDLIARGGEGAVHHIREAPDLAAKIYNGGKAAERRDKVVAMVQAKLHSSSNYVAFPVETLSSTDGRFVGFTMRKVQGFKSVHELYGPASRRSEFPDADPRMLLRTAANLARSVASVHASNCVIGDINHSGILVSSRSLVTLIDSDSFQFRAQSQLYHCLVGVEEYTPPELQGAVFTKTERTPNHDNFGLAVLLFQLLFLGRHPFAGRYLDKGDMDIRTAIREGRFAYSDRRAETRMEPPPYVPALGDHGPGIKLAFETAFMPPGRIAKGRVPAAEWVETLKDAEAALVDCVNDKSHSYHRSLPACPWCGLEKTMGRSLFAAKVGHSAPVMDFGQLIASINRATGPGMAPDPASLLPQTPAPGISESGKRARVVRKVTLASGIAAVLIGLYLAIDVQGFWGLALAAGAGTITYRSRTLEIAFAGELRTARASWDEQVKNWTAKAGPDAFNRRKAHLQTVATAHAALPSRERERIASLEQKKRQLQLQKHMESHTLERAKVKGIGAGRKATLASYGVENAWDVQHQNITAVPGIGPSLASELQRWARTVEHRFIFNNALPTDPVAVQAIKSEIAKQRAELERDLVRGPGELQRLTDEAMRARASLPQSLIEAFMRLRQAEADVG